MINHLLDIYPVPTVMAVTGLTSDETTERISSKFDIKIPLSWVACDPANRKSIREVLLKIKSMPQAEKEEKEQ